MEDITLTTVQADIKFGEKFQNFNEIEKLLDKDPNLGSDIIVLPEMFSTGFITEDVQNYAESMNGVTFEWMSNLSIKHNAVVTGSFIINESERFYNRMLWIEPGGNYYFYDKYHLFKHGGEHRSFSPTVGDKVIVKYKGWLFFLSVCYDIRFPVWMRNQNQQYDVIINIASWPEKRHKQWKILLQARALENQSYLVASNRIGTDHKGYEYKGGSCFVSPVGEIALSAKHTPTTLTFSLSRQELELTRRAYPFLRDADPHQLL